MIALDLPDASLVGNPIQLAFVPADFDQALHFWTNMMGAGPFFVRRDRESRRSLYRGRAVDLALTVAFGQWGELQIELLRQDNVAPSVYSDFSAAAGSLHHLGFFVDDLDAVRTYWEARGGKVIQERTRSDGTGLIYLQTVNTPILEYIAPTPRLRQLFEVVKDAAAGWDGSDRIRDIPPDLLPPA
jgi:methylmalonyl-CoA/ethylmalonyl-CoA epimerase